jgi:ATP-dependent DNA ligase
LVFFWGSAYLDYMPSTFDFCLPTRSTSVPDTPDCLHEVKYDGYRLRLERDGDGVRLITRGVCKWTDRYPWIVEAALKVRQKRFVLDGEADILGVDGISEFSMRCRFSGDYPRIDLRPDSPHLFFALRCALAFAVASAMMSVSAP